MEELHPAMADDSMDSDDRHEQLLAIEYIAAMLSQLRLMAQSKELHVLAYLIDMAQIEASETATQIKVLPPLAVRN
ncbi:MAG: hypothetical protein M9924_16825 [Rhizobiaceae bacterium]|nr:hypothetical protein [Rhizobiaceae bacterium]